MGKKLSRALILYAKMRVPFLKENPTCARCCGPATDVHHKQGRGPYLLQVDTWLPVCRPCHGWIHHNDAEARALGFLLNRHSK